MHAEYRHAGINDIHPVQSKNIGNRATAAQIDSAKLRRLEVHLFLFKNGAQMCQILRIGIIASCFSMCTGEFVKYHTAADIGHILFFESRSKLRIIGAGNIGRKHAGIGQASAQLQLAVISH